MVLLLHYVIWLQAQNTVCNNYNLLECFADDEIDVT